MVLRKHHRTSLKDLAAELGVSIATVSRALHGSHEVSQEMQEKVKALALKRHYRPNPFAQSLRKEAPHIIGVIVPNLVRHYFASVLSGVEDYASQHGYSVISSNSHESYLLEEKALENFYSLHVDGIIACLSQDTVDFSFYERLAQIEMPLVFFGRACMSDKFSQVVGNGEEASYEATRHLIEQGSRRVAFIGGPNHLQMVQRRKHGYLQALRDAGLPIDKHLVWCGRLDFDLARQATIDLLVSETRPDAILAFNDILTYAAFDAIKSLKLRIPNDVAIIGFTDGDKSAFVTPALSAIIDQAHQQGMKACEILINRINGDRGIYKEVIPMILKYRASSEKKHMDSE